MKILGLLCALSLMSLSSTTLPSFVGDKQDASKPDGRFYNTSLAMDFSDESAAGLSSYYGDVTGLSGVSLLKKLYNTIHIPTASISTHFVTYDNGVTKWYKITDRDWNLSQAIDPSTYKFTSDTGNNFYERMLYFKDVTTESKQINTGVNSFTRKDGLTTLDWTNKYRPSCSDPSGKTNDIQVDKEHVWVKSHGFPPQSKDPAPGAGTDLHHLIAADHNTNNIHNDNYYGIVANHDASSTSKVYCHYADGTYDVSGWLGLTNEGETCFEPTDQWKGDIARSLLYMATAYGKKLDTNSESEPYLALKKGKQGADDNTHYHGVFHNLEDYLDWNELDPVDDYESHRNNLIYHNVQQNRNPYVDHPEWARLVFNDEYLAWDGVMDGGGSSSEESSSSEGEAPSSSEIVLSSDSNPASSSNESPTSSGPAISSNEVSSDQVISSNESAESSSVISIDYSLSSDPASSSSSEGQNASSGLDQKTTWIIIGAASAGAASLLGIVLFIVLKRR